MNDQRERSRIGPNLKFLIWYISIVLAIFATAAILSATIWPPPDRSNQPPCVEISSTSEGTK